jgi:hypothetical protein
MDVLHRAGWNVGDVMASTAKGREWLVTGTNGENVLRVTAPTQARAWLLAREQAEMMWRLGSRFAEIEQSLNN